MRIFNLLCVLFVVTSRGKCQDGDLDALIDQVFGPGLADQTRRESFDDMNTGEVARQSGCVCVPYYLCQNNTIVTDGTGVIDVRTKKETCPGLIDVCCEQPLDESQKITPAPIIREGCGIRNPQGVGFRITGNEDGEAQFGEFPWMAAVLAEEITPMRILNIYQCGGALIHPEVVMTAAHCVIVSHKVYKVRVGEWDTQTKSELFPHQDIRVKKIVIHPRYQSGSLQNDVALLFLDSAVTLTDNIGIVCLPKPDEVFDDSRCFASGWGKDLFEKEGKYQVILKKLELPVVPRYECEEALRNTRLGPYFRLHPSFICAGGEEGRDTCKGDGGSPLVCPLPNQKNKYVQAGIVAWGIECGKRGTPGVYANVASFRDWIDEQFLYHSLSTNYYDY